MHYKKSIFWFRRDLRITDNAGLYYALKQSEKVIPVFIFDKNILSQLSHKNDARVSFIHQYISEVKAALLKEKSDLITLHEQPEEIILKLAKDYGVDAVFCNEDYEPYATKRDATVCEGLKAQGIEFHAYKDQVIFEKDEVVKENGAPYSVYTPYSKVWLQMLSPFYLKSYPVEKYLKNLCKDLKHQPIPSFQDLGFEKTAQSFPNQQVSAELMHNYAKTRNLPYLENGTSQISAHLRFGTISIRALARKAHKHDPTYLKELIWREFFMCILWHYPSVVTHAFKPQYDDIKWRNNEAEFQKWCKGETGYPIVDAGMRELNESGIMHNRIRMVTASFLVKHLLIDWRWGEAYFAEKLLDYELSSNNGNWQWVAGSGCDSAPYFRVFNPGLQQQKFDPERLYIKRWVAEIDSEKYPEPMVDHKEARNRAISAYTEAVGKKKNS